MRDVRPAGRISGAMPPPLTRWNRKDKAIMRNEYMSALWIVVEAALITATLTIGIGAFALYLLLINGSLPL